MHKFQIEKPDGTVLVIPKDDTSMLSLVDAAEVLEDTTSTDNPEALIDMFVQGVAQNVFHLYATWVDSTYEWPEYEADEDNYDQIVDEIAQGPAHKLTVFNDRGEVLFRSNAQIATIITNGSRHTLFGDLEMKRVTEKISEFVNVDADTNIGDAIKQLVDNQDGVMAAAGDALEQRYPSSPEREGLMRNMSQADVAMLMKVVMALKATLYEFMHNPDNWS